MRLVSIFAVAGQICRGGDPVDQLIAIQIGFQQCGGLTVVGQQAQVQRVQIEQQGVRPDVVGAIWFVVECGRIIVIILEMAVIEHDIAANFAQSALAKLVQPQPEFFYGQLGIAIAFKNKIAVQHTVFQFSIQIGFSLPAIGRP